MNPDSDNKQANILTYLSLPNYLSLVGWVAVGNPTQTPIIPIFLDVFVGLAQANPTYE